MNCALADKGAADYRAGLRDEALYNDADGGADYRRGWQLARLAPPPQDSVSAPECAGEAQQPGPAPAAQERAPEPAAVPIVAHRAGAPNQWAEPAAPEKPARKPKPALKPKADQLDLFS